MNHTVDWLPDAFQSFLLIWVRSADPFLARRAKEEIDRMLSTNPETGKLLPEGFWLLKHLCLRIHYEIDAANKQVSIVICNPADEWTAEANQQ